MALSSLSVRPQFLDSRIVIVNFVTGRTSLSTSYPESSPCANSRQEWVNHRAPLDKSFWILELKFPIARRIRLVLQQESPGESQIVIFSFREPVWNALAVASFTTTEFTRTILRAASRRSLCGIPAPCPG